MDIYVYVCINSIYLKIGKRYTFSNIYAVCNSGETRSVLHVQFTCFTILKWHNVHKLHCMHVFIVRTRPNLNEHGLWANKCNYRIITNSMIKIRFYPRTPLFLIYFEQFTIDFFLAGTSLYIIILTNFSGMCTCVIILPSFVHLYSNDPSFSEF